MLCALRASAFSMKHFICPLCQQAFTSNAQGLACSAGHQFDAAKEGYFNLLPVQHKHSRTPGDAKAQLVARRKFLNAGFFSPLVDSIKTLIPESAQTLLDIGCGEGYFTGAFAQQLKPADVYGIDIAKDGVRLAAKSYPANYAVASSYSLPIADASMNVITRIYAPSKDEELQRVLAPEGRLIIVTPGQNHLFALRRAIYDNLRPHPEPEAPEGFVALEHHQLQFPLSIPAGELSEAVLQMTPFAWRLSLAQQQALATSGIEDQADFHVSVYGTV